jgi:hypothetical protein
MGAVGVIEPTAKGMATMSDFKQSHNRGLETVTPTVVRYLTGGSLKTLDRRKCCKSQTATSAFNGAFLDGAFDQAPQMVESAKAL